MEIGDPFVPALQPDDSVHVELPEQWLSPFAPAAAVETEAPVEEESAAAVPAAVVTPTFSAATAPVNGASKGDGLDRAKTLADQLADALQGLRDSLAAGENERSKLLDERRQMQDRIAALEVEADHKRRFKETITSGMSASLTDEDLSTMQSMADALVQDPDRLTILFQVVQQASKLATALTVYSRLRAMAQDL